MAKLWQFLQGHPKPAFSVKVQRGDQAKFFKNRPKSSPRLKGPKAHWRKCHYLLISMHLTCKHWRTFLRKQLLQECPNGQVLGIFARSFKARIFWKSAKGGPREIFQKSFKKKTSFKTPKSTLTQTVLSSNYYPFKGERLEKILAQRAALKVPEWPSYGNFCKVTQKPHFLKKC